MSFYDMRTSEQAEVLRAIVEMLNRQPGISGAYWKWNERTVARIYFHLDTPVGDIHAVINDHFDDLWDKAQDN